MGHTGDPEGRREETIKKETIFQSQLEIDVTAVVRFKVTSRRALENYLFRLRESKRPLRTSVVAFLTLTPLSPSKDCCSLYLTLRLWCT